jgi:hypothetical protein
MNNVVVVSDAARLFFFFFFFLESTVVRTCSFVSISSLLETKYRLRLLKINFRLTFVRENKTALYILRDRTICCSKCPNRSFDCQTPNERNKHTCQNIRNIQNKNCSLPCHIEPTQSSRSGKVYVVSENVGKTKCKCVSRQHTHTHTHTHTAFKNNFALNSSNSKSPPFLYIYHCFLKTNLAHRKNNTTHIDRGRHLASSSRLARASAKSTRVTPPSVIASPSPSPLDVR